MTRDDAIREACAIVALAYQAEGDYRHASDGFCSLCPAARSADWQYRNEGRALRFVRLAVVREIKRRGLKIPGGWDRYGREIVSAHGPKAAKK